MKKYILPISLVTVLMIIIFPGSSAGQVKIKLKPFVGLGVSLSSTFNPPLIPIEDDFDQLYYDRNLAPEPGLAFRGQARVNLIHISDLSLGYQFWEHRHQFTDDEPYNQIKVYNVYPNSYVYSLHAPTLQWTLNYRYLSSRHIKPFILAGYGIFYGSAKSQYYEWKDTDQTILGKVIIRGDTWDGEGFLIGAGATVFRYAYVYIGWVELLDKTLHQYRFFDFTVGVTF